MGLDVTDVNRGIAVEGSYYFMGGTTDYPMKIVGFQGQRYSLKGFVWEERGELDAENIDTNGLNWSSKDFDFENLGAKKTIKKVYLTYSAYGTSDTNIMMKYSIDGDASTLHDFSEDSKFDDKTGEEDGYTLTSNGGLKGTDGEFRTIELLPSVKAACRKINSIQLHMFNPGGVVNTRELNIDDMTIIFKEYSTK